MRKSLTTAAATVAAVLGGFVLAAEANAYEATPVHGGGFDGYVVAQSGDTTVVHTDNGLVRVFHPTVGDHAELGDYVLVEWTYGYRIVSHQPVVVDYVLFEDGSFRHTYSDGTTTTGCLPGFLCDGGSEYVPTP